MKTNYYLSRINTRGSSYGSYNVLIIIKGSSNCSITWRSDDMGFRVTRLIKNKPI